METLMTEARVLDAAQVHERAGELAALTLDAVADGASVGFMGDLTAERATAWWEAFAAQPGARLAIACEDAQGICGALILAPSPLEIQPHRADLFKVMVHRHARGRGIASRLLAAAEAQALAQGRWQLTLLTRRGCDAEHLYRKLGWTAAGVIPDDSLRPDGTLCDAAVYFKRLA